MKTFTADPELICRRLSRLANIARWALIYYLIWWSVTSMVRLVIRLVDSGFAGVLTMFGLFLPTVVLKGMLPVALLVAMHFLVRGVKKKSKFALVINVVLISCVYWSIAGLAVYSLFFLPLLYSEQLAAGAREGWLIAFVTLGSSSAIALATVLVWRWCLHIIATIFLFSLGKNYPSNGKPCF